MKIRMNSEQTIECTLLLFEHLFIQKANTVFLTNKKERQNRKGFLLLNSITNWITTIIPFGICCEIESVISQQRPHSTPCDTT